MSAAQRASLPAAAIVADDIAMARTLASTLRNAANACSAEQPALRALLLLSADLLGRFAIAAGGAS